MQGAGPGVPFQKPAPNLISHPGKQAWDAGSGLRGLHRSADRLLALCLLCHVLQDLCGILRGPCLSVVAGAGEVPTLGGGLQC